MFTRLQSLRWYGYSTWFSIWRVRGIILHMGCSFWIFKVFFTFVCFHMRFIDIVEWRGALQSVSPGPSLFSRSTSIDSKTWMYQSQRHLQSSVIELLFEYDFILNFMSKKWFWQLKSCYFYKVLVNPLKKWNVLFKSFCGETALLGSLVFSRVLVWNIGFHVALIRGVAKDRNHKGYCKSPEP